MINPSVTPVVNYLLHYLPCLNFLYLDANSVHVPVSGGIQIIVRNALF